MTIASGLTLNEEYKHNSCKQSECPLKESGLCLEGLSVEECPHAFFEIDYEEDENINSEPSAEAENITTLFSSEEMLINEISTITYESQTRLIILIGEPDSGKTTLLASIHDGFQKGPIGEYLFAGSKTLVGFERRCHHARMASGRLYPETERTKSSDFSFLHLVLRPKETNTPKISLLFADVSGERFRLAKDYHEEMLRLDVLKRADELFYIANGDHLSNSALRFAAKENIIKFIERARQTGMISQKIGLRILISKWDIVVQRSSEQQMRDFFITPIENRFSGIVKSIEPVAVRANTASTLGPRFGLSSFLQACAKQNNHGHLQTIVPHFDSNSREFLKLHIG